MSNVMLINNILHDVSKVKIAWIKLRLSYGLSCIIHVWYGFRMRILLNESFICTNNLIMTENPKLVEDF